MKGCTEMRDLWAVHVHYTHDFIVASFAKAKDLPEVTSRLLQNQVDIGHQFKDKYGKEASRGVAYFLTYHILIAKDLVDDVISGNKDKLVIDQEKWRANARDLIAYICGLKKHGYKHYEGGYQQEKYVAGYYYKDAKYDKDCFKKNIEMMYEHLNITTNELVAYAQGRYSDAIKYLDKAREEALMMAEMWCKLI